MFDVALFGSLTVSTPDGRVLGARDFGGRKPKQLFEILSLHHGRHVPKDQLADLLWGDRSPRNINSALEHYVSVLRHRLVPGDRLDRSPIMTDHGGYRLVAERTRLDTVAVDALLDELVGRPDRAEFDRALAMLSGDLLEDEPYAEWAAPTRCYFRQRLLQLRVSAAEHALSERDAGRARELAAAAVTADPLGEPALRALMRAHYLLGDQAAALGVFDRGRRHLATELGLDPQAETVGLHRAILRQTPAETLWPQPTRSGEPVPVAGRAAPTAAPAVCQVPGPLLLGRQAELDTLVALCAEIEQTNPRPSGVRLVTLTGEHGVGKSRLLDETAARMRGTEPLRVRCLPVEQAVALATMSAIVRRATGGVGPVAEQLLNRFAMLPAQTASPPLELVHATAEVLRAYGPRVVLVDDAHHADPRSVTTLALLARHSSLHDWLVVLAFRTEDVAHDHPLASLEVDRTIELLPLDVAELRGCGLPGLHERTGGVPLHLPLALPAPRPASDSPAEEARRRVLARCSGFGEPLARLLSVAATLPEPFGPHELARLVGSDPADVVEQLERLCAARMLRVDGELGFTFRYPVVREVLREQISLIRRRLLSRRVRHRSGDRRVAGPSGARPERRSAQDRRTGAHRTPDTASLLSLVASG